MELGTSRDPIEALAALMRTQNRALAAMRELRSGHSTYAEWDGRWMVARAGIEAVGVAITAYAGHEERERVFAAARASAADDDWTVDNAREEQS
jgi:hypothetical protein